MPYAIPKLCSACHDTHTGRCPRNDKQRGSRTARGYDADWYRFRTAYIATVVADDPFCQDCRRGFMRTSEIELHHIRKLAWQPELKYEESNIRHLCKQCHARRTERGE